MWWYNAGIRLYSGAIGLAAPFKEKARLWKKGRRGIMEHIAQAVNGAENVIWVHAASLGEFEQGRPVIEEIRERHPEYRILLTFFSPSGYEIRKNYNGADWVFYLPADTPSNARRFLDAVRPVAAIFIKYEFWLNYLRELDRRAVPTYIISAIFRKDSVFFRPYGAAFRRALRTFRRLFVQDDESARLLAGIGVDNVTVAGDTRFDRVCKIAGHAASLPIVERFMHGGRAFVAGSTWPPDEELLLRLMDGNRQMRFIVAPHEMDSKRIESLIAAAPGGGIRYSACNDEEYGADRQLLVIDTIGILSSVYVYASHAYIGGGFGAGIHNTLEAAVFGIPVAFGPNYGKFREACELVECGAARSVASYDELEEWLSSLPCGSAEYVRAAEAAGHYVLSRQGATEAIMATLFGK